VPAGTQAPIVTKLMTELGKALADPGVQDGLQKMAVKPGGPTGDAFKKRIDDDIKTFAEVVKAANLTFKYVCLVKSSVGLISAVCSESGPPKKTPPTPVNPDVSITMPNAGLVLEDHNLGPDYAVNRYRVLSPEKVSATNLAISVL